MFVRYCLRTTDVEGARQFYADALGLELPAAGVRADSPLELWPLHEQARARGAPAHWLGQLVVPDLEGTIEHWLALGAERLGPPVRTEAGASFSTLRDPFGAVLALRADESPRPAEHVGWHQLHVRDCEAAYREYGRLTHWVDAGHVDTPEVEGGHRLFAWQPSSPAMGSVANTARWAGVHCQWLFHFWTDDIDAALTRVRQLGGTAMPPIDFPNGGPRVSACEDPQGAAFGLIRRVTG